MKKIVIGVIPFLLFACFNKKQSTAIPVHTQQIKNEPSAIVFFEPKNVFYVLGDNGWLTTLDTSFAIINRDKWKKGDFEGLTANGKFLYALNEKNSEVLKVKPKKKKIKDIEVMKLPSPKLKNKGFEGITWNNKNELIAVIEDEPCTIVVFDSLANLKKEVPFSYATDLSDVLWHDNKYYLLSDLDEAMYVLDSNFKLEYKVSVPVFNPEGICFYKNKLIVVSDQDEELYVFNKEEIGIR